MNFRLFLVILRSRYRLILVTMVITIATAAQLTSQQPRLYIATTSLVLNFKTENPFQQAGIPVQLSSSYVATQLDIIKSRKVALKVVDQQNMTDDPDLREAYIQKEDRPGTIQDWLAGVLLWGLMVEPSRDSRVINIGFRSTDQNEAAELANAFARAYIETALELSREPARQSALWFDDQLKVLRERLERAQARLTSFQQEKGIMVVDERLDTETDRFNELSKKYVAAQSDAYDVKSRQLGKKHPEYTRAVKREASLRYSLETQKEKILELMQQRDKVAVLAREVEIEQKNYESTLTSYYKTLLESQFNQTNISILNPAIVPVKPDSPNVMLNMLSAIFLGLLLSISLAVGLEMLDRRVRTEEEIRALLGTKVLATV